jgi:hypothetical protein
MHWAAPSGLRVRLDSAEAQLYNRNDSLAKQRVTDKVAN